MLLDQKKKTSRESSKAEGLKNEQLSEAHRPCVKCTRLLLEWDFSKTLERWSVT